MKKRILLCFVLVLLLLLVSCQNKSASKMSSEPDALVHYHGAKSILWKEFSAEYRALCYQSFNMARQYLDSVLLRNGKGDKPRAIITDIDETILNNSPFSASMIKEDTPYSKDKWIEWGEKASARPLPGALSFLNYVKSKGLQIYYISNRYDIQKEETIENLKKTGMPFADEAHMFLKDKTSDKSSRREQVMKSSEIVMLLGDNILDFSGLFQNKGIVRQNKIVDSIRGYFGRKFIVLPNPVYGSWEQTLYGKATTSQKDSITESLLSKLAK